MAVADEPTLAPRAARGPSDPAKVVRASPGGSLLGLLIGRGLSKLAGWFAPLGRYSLYVGLLLVALTVLRLPGGNGGVADVFAPVKASLSRPTHALPAGGCGTVARAAMLALRPPCAATRGPPCAATRRW
jgi:hypothetical protein